MTPLEIAKIFNVVGQTVVLGTSLLIGMRYPGPFFAAWSRAYGATWVVLVLEWVASYVGRPGWLFVLQSSIIATTIWFLLQAARTFDRPPMPARGLGWLLAASITFSTALALAGTSYNAAIVPYAIGYALALMWLGWRVFRAPPIRSMASWFLGGSLVLSGLSVFTFPVLADGPHAWLGYLGSSLLNLVLGMGLVTYLVEATARELAAKNAELTRLDALKNSFMRTMSHELRTPLTTIMAASSLLSDGPGEPLGEARKDLARTITKQSELLERLVTEVLDYARLESGTMAYVRQDIDLPEVARECARAMGPVLAARGLTLVLEEPDPSEDDVWVHADHARLVQVGLNLLANAAKFTPAGGTVTLSVWRDGDEGCLAVRDTGIGIAPEHQARIFERFYQVDAGSTRKYGGMGLGLALCRAIVEDGHHGRLRVESEPGRGSRFVVALPALARTPRDLTER